MMKKIYWIGKMNTILKSLDNLIYKIKAFFIKRKIKKMLKSKKWIY
jgi:hypothetical protein